MAAMSVPVDLREDARGVYTLTIERAAKRNALNREVMTSLIAALAQVSDRDEARAVVLTGAGQQAFCGGADLGEMAALEVDSARAFITLVHRTCRACIDCPVPVVARIDGVALGAGLELAAACDLRVASATARFAMPEVMLGMPSVVEAALLPRLVGAGRARRLVYTGETIDAATALAWGLVDEVAPPDRLDDAVARIIDAMLRAGPRALRAQKRVCGDWDELPLAAAVERSIEAFAATWDHDEARVRLAALAGRKAAAS